MSKSDILANFFFNKMEMDNQAKAKGKLRAAPSDYYPILQQTLDLIIGHKNEKKEACYQLSEEESNVLLNFARNMAVAAVRESDPNLLRYGLGALVIENQQLDPRETFVHLFLLRYSAEILKYPLEHFWRELSSIAESKTASDFQSFFTNSEAKDLSEIGYKEIKHNGKFDYKRDW